MLTWWSCEILGTESSRMVFGAKRCSPEQGAKDGVRWEGLAQLHSEDEELVTVLRGCAPLLTAADCRHHGRWAVGIAAWPRWPLHHAAAEAWGLVWCGYPPWRLHRVIIPWIQSVCIRKRISKVSFLKNDFFTEPSWKLYRIFFLNLCWLKTIKSIII